MTLTKDLTAKLAVATVAVAMVFSAFVSSAKAQTTEELQQMINDLLAQVAQLQSQLGNNGGSGNSGSMMMTSSVCPYTWTRSLSQGSTGSDVMKLQKFLNSDPDTRVAVSGVGSMGMETDYYGPATAAAVSKFQVKYRSDILSPVNLVNPTGYFGPSTMAKANMLCSSANMNSGNDNNGGNGNNNGGSDNNNGGNGNNNGGSDNNAVTLSGEASLDTLKIDSADDDTIEEGANDATLAELEVEFKDGDAKVSRLDLQLLANGQTNTNTVKPWDAFDSVSVWVDGDKIKEVDANRKSDYLDEDAGTIRLTGLDIVAKEDKRVKIVVAADIQNNLDSAELTTWTASAESIRYFDADGVATTENAPTLELGDNVNFDLVVAGNDDEIIVKTSSSDPDAATLKVEDNKKSDWYDIFAFDLDTNDSENDVVLDNVLVTVEVSSSTFDTLVDDYELTIDGTKITDVTVTNGTTTTATLDFKVDGDVTIDKGDRVKAVLALRFNSLATGNEGVTVRGKVTSANANAIDATGADDLTTSQLSGAATGDYHTLRTKGIDGSLKSVSSNNISVDGSYNDKAEYTIKVDVKAFEQDVYISTNDATSTAWSLVDSAGNSVPAGTTRLVTFDSTADIDGNYFRVDEGTTETFTLKVTYVPGAATSARLQLNSLNFAETATAPTQTWNAEPATDYRTDIESISN